MAKKKTTGKKPGTAKKKASTTNDGATTQQSTTGQAWENEGHVKCAPNEVEEPEEVNDEDDED